MDQNTLRKLRGLQAGKSSNIPNKTDSSVSVGVSNSQDVSNHDLSQMPISSDHLDQKESKDTQQNLSETKKTEESQKKGLTQNDLAQIVRQARGLNVSSSHDTNTSPAEEEIYSFITPDMIDENGYLKMSEEGQKALIEGIYEFFKTGLEPNNSPQHPEPSDQ